MATYQILVKHLDGTTLTLQFPTPTLTGRLLKSHLQSKTKIPSHLHRLTTGAREILDQTLLTVAAESNLFPSANLLLCLRGGKGGFGSLLRGAATKAGQKKTINFDACRDMSGRRLRHVNAEKRLEEWKGGEEDRRLEKVAEQFLKKKANEVKKKKDGAVEKYIEKYREDSERCMGEVEESVRQSFGLYEEKKRKVLPTSGPEAKRLKVWLGKKTVEESDSDSDEDDESDYEDEKSVVLDAGNQKDGEGSSASGSQSDRVSLGGGSSQSNVEEGPNGFMEVGEGSGSRNYSDDSDSFTGPENSVHEETAGKSLFVSCLERPIESDEVKEGAWDLEVASQEQISTQDSTVCLPEKAIASDEVVLMEGSSDGTRADYECSPEKCLVNNEANLVMEKLAGSEPVYKEQSDQITVATNSNESLNFDDISSAAELEVLGMERLKKVLQANGLKCGGTLQERAARLFLLKTTPVEKLPKKLLAKPT